MPTSTLPSTRHPRSRRHIALIRSVLGALVEFPPRSDRLALGVELRRDTPRSLAMCATVRAWWSSSSANWNTTILLPERDLVVG